MIEMRWVCTTEVETVPFDFARDTIGGKPRTQTVVKKTLQYRQKVDVTVRAGIWPADDIVRTANYQWSEWKDVPEIVERDPGCP